MITISKGRIRFNTLAGSIDVVGCAACSDMGIPIDGDLTCSSAKRIFRQFSIVEIKPTH